MEQPALELTVRTNTINPRPQEEQPQEISREFSLPPADRGKDAWLLLAAAFVVEGLIWGPVFSFGVFQEYYTNLALLRGQESQIPLIGTISSGIIYLSSPVAMPLCRHFPHRRRQAMVAGVVVLCAALVGASFARSARDLVLTQGVLFGIGCSMAYYPVFMFIDEFFIQRKGLAYGIMWASSGFSGLVLPYIFSWSLNRYSFRTTLRMWAVVNLVLITPALPALKPRLPASTVVRWHWPRLTFAMKPLFIIYQVAFIIESLGYFLPGIYLPSYARSLGLSKPLATTTVSLLNVGAFSGFICGGFLTDRWAARNVIFLATIGTTLASAFMWGFSSNAGVLIVFAAFYGFFGAFFVTTWPGITRVIISRDATQTAEASTIYASFVAGRGIGSVVSGPLSQGLLHLPRLTRSLAYGYGSMYGTMIVFNAVTMLLGGLAPAFEALGMV